MNTLSKEPLSEKAGTMDTTSRFIQHHVQISDDDEGNPRYWPAKKKCAIALYALFCSFIATLGTPIYVAAIPSVGEHFHVGTTLAIAPLSFYAYGIGIGALLGTAACEVFGRRIVYQVTIPLCLTFTIVGGSAKTFAVIAVARSLAGLFAGPSITVGSGIVNDLWDVSLHKTGSTFAVGLGMFIMWATQIGPMISASLLTYHSWRWVFWMPAILIGVTAVGAFTIPETYMPQILRNRATKEKAPVQTERNSLRYLISVGRPLHMILVEPLILPTGLVLAVTQSVAFAYYVAFALVFEEVYGFSQYQVGMAFGPQVVGSIFAVLILGLFDKLTYQKARAEAIRSGTNVVPETRLYPAMLSSVLLPVSLFWLAWTSRHSVHWIVPVLSGLMFGCAYVISMLMLPVYNNDVYTIRYGASAFAATTFIRFIISSSFPLFTAQMVRKLGFPWAISLLGFIALVMMPIPWIFFKWGSILRKRSRYVIVKD